MKDFRAGFCRAQRDVSVYLPPGYEHGNGRDYPLLVLQDGQNLFDPETAFIRGRTWRVADKRMRRLRREKWRRW